MSRTIMTSMLALSLALSASSMAYADMAAPARVIMHGQTKILTDAHGWSLYTFDEDQPGKSECTLLCATAWPPFEAPASARTSGHWSLIRRSSGVLQWAYKGSPLYTYRLDFKPGEIRGDGAEGIWHLAKP
ncbi:putative lipoprotein with Yx(FWY)xxD motif [Phyllobacterium bourgognense]|uniref:Putative lipoprotein with Yx(FWY)xxD motif n=2 Tax=Phyllobacterium bourgognense TaxID=314236 RepID=A0A368YI59_9HYPH|nr:putative lipoprotein with Yx(FWY)xxD motif [Phyllobacterium bourgognense]